MVSHLLEAEASKRRSKAGLEQILSATSGISIDSIAHLFEIRRDTMLPDDRLLARLHLAKIAGNESDIFRLTDSARMLELAPPESLAAWRIQPREADLARRLATLDFSGIDLVPIVREADACLARDSTILDCHVAGAMAAALDRNWQDLRRRTDRAIQIRPGDFRLQGFRGIGFLLDGDLAAARAWLPDARDLGSDSLPYGYQSKWTSRLFRPWRTAIDSVATDSFCIGFGIPDSIRNKLPTTSPNASPTGFVSCTVAPDTYGAIHLCRPQAPSPTSTP